MPRQVCRRLAESSESSGERSPKRHTGNSFLAIDQWGGSQEDAGLVEASRTPALSAGALHQVAWWACSQGGITRCPSLRGTIVAALAATFRIIATRTPASSILFSIALAAR